ncbi:MAG TPA: MBL fold metallo-hydrolase [Acidimicrobiales bacterium]|nr:MBL fold metallo-hydrolase [Acidimicrobiales bacterium]
MPPGSPAEPLPPVEQLRPGLWSIPVPIPNNPLRYVLVYAFDTDRGPYLVDAGWNTDDAYQTLVAGLAEAGFDIADVQGVLVTHIHPDHYGLAGRVREASGAWVGLHPEDAALIKLRYLEPDALLEGMGQQLRMLGAPESELRQLQEASMEVRPFVWAVDPDVLIEDGDKPEVPGWDLQAIWTPGHSPGHLCFWEAGLRLMLSGDHVLPRITPNIGLHPQSGDDPLGSYIESLDKVGAYDAASVLPAHEHRFVGLAGRVAQLKTHHEERLAEAVRVIAAGHSTAWEVAERMVWSRPWDRIQGFMRRAAVTEIYAHLRRLERRGTLRAVGGEPLRWEIVESAGR